MEGWRQALRAAGAPEPSLLRGDWSARSGYEIGHRLATMPEVTAVQCGNDQMALGLLRALAEHGRHVPDDVSVVGFDDFPEAAFFQPPLTTVRQNFVELGRRALHLLLDHISGERGPRTDAAGRSGTRRAGERGAGRGAAGSRADRPPAGCRSRRLVWATMIL